GATNEALARCKKIIAETLETKSNIFLALLKCRRELSKVKVDRTLPKPKVGIIGEFWAMTTEGDGNYQLQRFLEQEGAEVDIQLVAAWLLYMIWESRNDTNQRKGLRAVDFSKYGLGELGTWGVAKREATLWFAEKMTRL